MRTMNDVHVNGVTIWMRNPNLNCIPDAKISMVNHHLPATHDYNLYDITFEYDTINTLVTASSFHVDSWLSTVHFHNRDVMVGLDVEWRPNFQPNGTRNRIATLQLCVGHRCLVFQIIHAHYIPHSLVSFLADPTVQFFGVGIGADVAKLFEDYNLHVVNVRDLRELAVENLHEPAYPNMRQAGLKAIARCLLDVEVEKPRRVTLSWWDNRWLSDEQVQYAVVDAFLSYELGRQLSNPHTVW